MGNRALKSCVGKNRYDSMYQTDEVAKTKDR